MPTPPPRKRFQIHLSTAIVMMFVAGALIWANVTERSQVLILVPDGKEFGWPFPAIRINPEIRENNSVFAGELVRPRQTIVNKLEIIKDVLTALVFLEIAHFLCEWLIRRRAARKGA